MFKLYNWRKLRLADRAPDITSLEAGDQARYLVQPLHMLTVRYQPSVWGWGGAGEVQLVARAVSLGLQWGHYDMVSSIQVTDVRARCGHDSCLGQCSLGCSSHRMT